MLIFFQLHKFIEFVLPEGESEPKSDHKVLDQVVDLPERVEVSDSLVVLLVLLLCHGLKVVLIVVVLGLHEDEKHIEQDDSNDEVE